MGKNTALIAILGVLAVVSGAMPPAMGLETRALPVSQAKLGSPAAGAVSAPPQADPGNLFAFAGSVGKVLRFTVVGTTQGTIWGSDVYTSDSVLAVAAVHAGFLKPGQGGIVSVEILPGEPSYSGAERNGVESLDYGNWDLAYRLTGVEPLDGPATLADPGTLGGFRGQNGTVMHFEVTGSVEGSVWGDGIYSDDSMLAAAAVHAGLLREGETGVVNVEIMPGQQSYDAAERNGVASIPYGSWGGSFRFVQALGRSVNGKLGN